MSEPNDDDLALFRQAVGQVKPLRQDRVAPNAPRPPDPKRRRLDDRQVMIESLTGQLDPSELETGEELIYLREGADRSLLKKLRRGGYRASAELDLHGHTEAQAREAVRLFLADCLLHRDLCVRIIHGKGLGSGNAGPVIKPALNRWLRLADSVIAFASAPPHDGGTGALYVLLKRAG